MTIRVLDLITRQRPISSCSIHSSIPHLCIWPSRMTSLTSRTGMRCRLAIANTSILPRVRVHAATSASVASRLVTRAALSAKRGSSRRSSRPHRPQQIVPMLLDRDVHCDVAVIGRVDVQRHAAMAGVAGARRHLAGVEIGVELRSQGRVGGLLHRHLGQADPGRCARARTARSGWRHRDVSHRVVTRTPSGAAVFSLRAPLSESNQCPL